MNKSLVKFIKLAFLSLPVLFVFSIIFMYGYNIVSWDEYDFVNQYKQIAEGENLFSLAFSCHNEHRIFFPKLIVFFLAWITNYNTKVQMYVGGGILSFTYLIFIKLVSNKKLSEFNAGEVILSTALGFVLMGLRQYENLLCGMQLAWFLIGTCAAAAMYSFVEYIKTEKTKYYILMLIAGTISCFSSLQGVVTWLALIMVVLLISFERRKFDLKKWMLLFVAALVELVIYFVGYHGNSDHRVLMADSVWTFLQYFFMEMGSPLHSNKIVQMIAGVIICLAVCIIIINLTINKKLFKHIDLIGIIVFGTGVAMMCSVGRANVGFVVSRYETYQTMSMASLIVLIYRLTLERVSSVPLSAVPRKLAEATAVITIIFSFCIVKTIDTVPVCIGDLADKKSKEEIMLNYKDESLDSLKSLFPWENYEDAYEMLGYMKENSLNVFSKGYELKYQETNIGDLIVHDYREDAVGFPGGWYFEDKILKIDSWAADTLNNTAYSRILIKINDKYYKTVDNISRQDVADHFNNQEFANTGFVFSKNTDNLNEGINKLQVLLVSENGKDSYLSHTVYIYKNQDGSLYMCNQDGTAIN